MDVPAWRRRSPGAVAVSVASAPARAVTRLRRRPPPQGPALVVLCGLAVALTAAGELVGFWLVPAATLVVPVLGAGLLLDRRRVRALLAVVAGCLTFDVLAQGVGSDGVRPGTVAALAFTAGVAYEFARSREETGLTGSSGEGVLVELRQRLELQGTLPPLPPPWRAEATICPADGGPFAGDFVVSAVTGGGHQLELVLVDVSGKGVAAGTRALMLSGALGGLLGAVPPEHFLPAANDYLLRQGWDEGFATAAHLALSLADGTFTLRSAGHPPPAVFDAGSGRWSLVEADGAALGLLPGSPYPATRGRLGRGDALLLYTDGLVEVPGRDLALGIDRLLGQAERLVASGFAGGTDALVAGLSGGVTDDRGIVLVRHP
ncbi:MAG: PP2C family protein-serine/threonine phosphatase [Actinomycetes bacterium]